LVGQNLGAGLPDDAQRAGRITRNMGMLVMSAMGVVFFLIPGPIVRIFSSDPEVIALAVVCLRLVAIAQPSLAAWMILAGGLRGAGDTRAIMKMVMLSFLGVRVGLAYLLALRLGLGLTGSLDRHGCGSLPAQLLDSVAFQQGRVEYVKV